MKGLALCCVCLLMLAAVAGAHPPKDIQISADQDKIDIVIVHNVDNPASHYIQRVQVWVNKKRIVDQQFVQQKDKTNQFAVYLYPGMKTGDKIKVEADCNLYGDLSKELVLQ